MVCAGFGFRLACCVSISLAFTIPSARIQALTPSPPSPPAEDIIDRQCASGVGQVGLGVVQAPEGMAALSGSGSGSVPGEGVLIEWAKRVVAHDMGLKDEDLLDDSFYFIGPFDGPVGKRLFIDGSKTFDLRGAFPDFSFNEHDFRVDKVQPLRVWFTTRKTGTHLGDLPMYGKVIKPTGGTLNFPPETYSCTFNTQGKVVKLTGGFVMDGQQGTSGGLGGPLGISLAVGHPQSPFLYEPPLRALVHTVSSKINTKAKSPKAATFVPPSSTTLSPEEVVSLSRVVMLEEDLGLKNPDRLAPDFTYYDAASGVTLGKDTYLARLKSINMRAAFPDLSVKAYNFRVDGSGLAPSTAWLTVRYTGTHTGKSAIGGARLAVPAGTGLVYESAPEAISITLNDQGLVARISGGAVLDREEGNTGGLGGLFGIRYALGYPSVPLVTRPMRFHTKGEWASALTATVRGLKPKWMSRGTGHKGTATADGQSKAKAQVEGGETKEQSLPAQVTH